MSPLVIYAAIVTALSFLLLIVTFVLLRRDKYFGLAMMCMDVALFVAVSTFGSNPFVGLVASISDLEFATAAVTPTGPSDWSATSVIISAFIMATALMGLRLVDKRISVKGA